MESSSEQSIPLQSSVKKLQLEDMDLSKISFIGQGGIV